MVFLARLVKFTALAVLFFLVPGSLGQITVQGIADRQTVTSKAVIQVVPVAGYEDTVLLNGRNMSSGSFEVSVAGYYDLLVTRSNTSTGETLERLVRFVVQDPVRGASEWGVAPWTPRPPIASAPEEFEGATLELIMPARYPAAWPVPVAVRVHRDGRQSPVNGTAVVTLGAERRLSVKRGFGSGRLEGLSASGSVDVQAALGGLSTGKAVLISNPPRQEVEADIAGAATWPAGSWIHVTRSFEIQPDASLRVEAGTVVLLDPGVEVTVRGTLDVSGSAEEPVVWAGASTQAWGGIVLWEGPARFTARHAIFTDSGADPRWMVTRQVASHRSEEALLYLGPGSEAELENVCIIQNAGQAFHGEDAYLTLRSTFVQECTTVGQFNGGRVQAWDSTFIDIPSSDSTYADQDNDAFYFTRGNHELRRCLIGWTKDDGVDAGADSSGQLLIDDCWFEACFHEALALSGVGKDVEVLNSVILNCSQGIEAGYLSPRVRADGCFISGNQVGLRFGDNYWSTHTGSLSATDSVVIYNDRDVWGMVQELWAEDLSRMDIQNNYLSGPNPAHPLNATWSSGLDGWRLQSWRNGLAPGLGAGFIQDSTVLYSRDSVFSAQVGLSSFATNRVAIPYTVTLRTAAGESIDLEPGALYLDAGQTVGNLSVQIIDETGLRAVQAIHVRLQDGDGVAVDPERSAFTWLLPSADAEITWVSSSDSWSYFKGTTEPASPVSAWRERTFDDAHWSAGPGPFGYGGGNVFGTAVPDMLDSYTTLYLRRSLFVSLAQPVVSVRFFGLYDDGFVLWLNGQEIFRRGVDVSPDAQLLHTAVATESDFSARPWEFERDGLDLPLRTGRNVLAVQVLNARRNSSDLMLDVSAVARVQADLDNDGLPDAWEDHYLSLPGSLFTDIRDFRPEDDLDDDGMSNLAEFLAGSDAGDSDDVLRLRVQMDGSGEVQLKVRVLAGRRYRIEFKDQWPDTWQVWHDVEPIADAPDYTVPVDATSLRFYRLLISHPE